MIITKNYNEIHERLFKKINVIEVLSTLKKKIFACVFCSDINICFANISFAAILYLYKIFSFGQGIKISMLMSTLLLSVSQVQFYVKVLLYRYGFKAGRS